MMQFGDLFTARQKLALCNFIEFIRALENIPRMEELLTLTLAHTIERCSSLCRWSPEAYMETILGVFGRQALPMIWDFGEAAILSDSTGSFMHGLGVKAQAVQDFPALIAKGSADLADAREYPLPDDS